jgi:hypothetical protein
LERDAIDAHRGRRRAQLGRTGIGASALFGTAALADSCGGGSAGPGVASIGSTTSTAPSGSAVSSVAFPNLQKAYQSQLAYAKCMRTHGEPGYPDPVLHARNLSTSSGNLDTSSTQYVSAASTCKRLVPNGGPPSAAQIQKATAELLKYAQCMRTHGVPSFPDPVVGNGSLSIKIGGPGLDHNSPQFQAAQKTCQKLAPLVGGA